MAVVCPAAAAAAGMEADDEAEPEPVLVVGMVPVVEPADRTKHDQQTCLTQPFLHAVLAFVSSSSSMCASSHDEKQLGQDKAAACQLHNEIALLTL